MKHVPLVTPAGLITDEFAGPMEPYRAPFAASAPM